MRYARGERKEERGERRKAYVFNNPSDLLGIASI
jgi:hypothetical protein